MLKLSLRKKIFLSYMVLIVILVFISILAVKHLLRLNQITDQVIEGYFQSISSAQNMLKILESHRRGLWMLSSGKRDQKEAEKIFLNSRKEFMARINEARRNAKIEGEEKLIGDIESNYRNFLEQYPNVKKNLDRGRGSERYSFYWTIARLQLDTLSKKSLQLLDMNRNAMFELNRKAKELSDRYIISMIIFSILAFVIGIILSLWLTHIIIGPVEELTKAASEVQKGNMDVEVKVRVYDEIGLLADEFNKMLIKMREYKQINLEKLLEEKKRTEAIIRSVGDCMIVIDTNYRIIMANPTAERIFYLLPGISYGRDFRDMIKSEKLFEIIKNSIDNEKDPVESHKLPTFKWEYNRQKKYFQVKVFPVSKEEGTHFGFVILLEDVTKLKELDQMKSDFISIASHELRTPLQSIVMSLGLILDGSAGNLNEEQKELMEAANEEAIRMKELMTNLLDISRIETGRIEMDFTEVDPEVLLSGVAASFSLQSESQTLKIMVNVKKGVNNVYADYNRIVQVLNNLIGNAMRYSPQGGRIILSACNEGEDYVRFSVEDEGQGIPADALEKIFQKFYQVRDDRHRGGAGLGLAVCQEIIKAQHGKIWVESHIGKGAKFIFLLPAVKEKEKETKRTQTA
ncbi:MAG: cell wall metabolism sensor histidine kinase WalK [Candidatus Eremiobacteraeota bacterium]|nr:cell wall metabolism sensor histidine kinase WalK [Candidatus Eremiobacteraeota bacterium]